MKTAVLPRFVTPMLASAAAPFNNEDWLFEIKWDGFRSICRADDSGVQLIGRRKTDYTSKFGAGVHLDDLPPGIMLDGEIVALKHGRPHFQSLLRGIRSNRPAHIRLVYVAFDILYHDFEPVMNRPCEARRSLLRQLLADRSHESLIYSETLSGSGVDCFEHASQLGLEGIIAKKKSSRYLPGIRNENWLKIKRRHQRICAIVGYELSEARGLRSLILAGMIAGKLTCMGRVGSGLDEEKIVDLLQKLHGIGRKRPVVDCKFHGHWVDPVLYCRVQYDQLLPTGSMRAPVFEGLVKPGASQSVT